MEIEKIKSIKDIKNVCINAFPIFFNKKDKIGIISMCFYRVDKNILNYEKYIKLNKDYYKLNTLFKKGLFGIPIGKYKYYLNFYKVEFEKDKLIKYPPQNLLKVVLKNKKEQLVLPLVYNIIHFKKYKGLTSRVYKTSNKDIVVFFRQAKLNSIAITVRKPNVTDKLENRIKIFLAKSISLITPKKNIVLLYEKEANKYEESASVVYEKLIDLGYKNCFYIINKNSIHNKFIKDKYLSNVINAHTFKHYYYFFKCHKFIGTETVPHSIELRAANKYILQKFIKKDYKYVFLQHGVMYMIALDSRSRSGFRKNGNELPNDTKIVVSSSLEANHFIELGGFDKSNLIISGLPFYDRTKRNKNAKKITIMLTWRSWDYNKLLTDYKKASYYKMCKNIIKNIPKEYLENVYLLPHPLILDKFKNTDLNKYIPEIASYDKILEETDLLITDYSSIAYSAFYRGSNVIFCWDELNECMKKYDSHLMLNENNVFGDITYDSKNIGELISKNYLKKQSQKYIKRYRKIVEFNDNKNTERLIEELRQNNII